jgi:hypothetical protein
VFFWIKLLACVVERKRGVCTKDEHGWKTRREKPEREGRRDEKAI